jgi:hypothetical protein
LALCRCNERVVLGLAQAGLGAQSPPRPLPHAAPEPEPEQT